MNRIAQDIMNFLQRYPGLSDRELTNLIFGALEPQQRINQECHKLEEKGMISRTKRLDGIIGNYLVQDPFPAEPPAEVSKTESFTIKCPHCKGTGEDLRPSNITGGKCPICKASGHITIQGTKEDYETDEICKGTGRDPYGIDPWKPHDICKGTGIVKK